MPRDQRLDEQFIVIVIVVVTVVVTVVVIVVVIALVLALAFRNLVAVVTEHKLGAPESLSHVDLRRGLSSQENQNLHLLNLWQGLTIRKSQFGAQFVLKVPRPRLCLRRLCLRRLCLQVVVIVLALTPVLTIAASRPPQGFDHRLIVVNIEVTTVIIRKTSTLVRTIPMVIITAKEGGKQQSSPITTGTGNILSRRL